MIYQNYKKHLFYPAFAAILAIAFLAMSNYIVKSQRTADFKPSPLKFNSMPAPNDNNLNNIPLPTTAGNLDPTFGTGGKLTTDFSSKELANAVAVQTDGKIVAAGTFFNGTNYEFAVIRYNADGSLDTSFDGDGKVTTSVGGDSNSAYAIAIQTDSKIVAGGYIAINNSVAGFALVRYNADGSLDASFGAGGKVTTAISYGAIYAIAIQTDGKIVAAGSSYTNTTTTFQDFTLARYNTDGSLDTSFDGDGKLTTDFGLYEYASGVAIQADGKIVAAGSRSDGDFGFSSFALARYNSDGSLDISFDTDGKVITNFGGYGSAIDVAIQTDGKIVAAGNSASCYIFTCAAADFTVVRYNTNGSLDTTFDGDGKVTTDFGDWDSASAVAIQTNGKIVAAGHAPNTDFALARYNPDGSLDTSFDADGKVTTDFDYIFDYANAVALQADGKIVAAGRGLTFALARYNVDGSLDTSFDGDGKVITPDLDEIRSVAIQTDGKIVAAGWVFSFATHTYFALARYNTNGSLDASFDSDGKVITAVAVNDAACGVAIQRNGKIVAAGTSQRGFPTFALDFALVRYNPNGSLDNSFDADGRVTTDFFDYWDSANAVAIQANGRIVAVGSARNGTKTDFAAARYIGDTVRVKFDYDGDGRADVSVFRPSMLNNGSWFVLRSSNGTSEQYNPGFQPADKIVPADYDGDGKTDIAQYNSTTGTWYIMRPGAPNLTVRFGSPGDLPVPADYDGDGKADLAVYRPSTGTWWILQSGNGAVLIQRFGLADDKPVAGDYDGDGKSDLAVYRPSEGIWYLLQSTAGFAAMRFGLAEDKPTVGDYDGDGRNDLAVFRPSTNVWYVQRSTNGSFFAVQFGLAADIPAPADFDGDGKSDIAVFRPSNGIWYILQSSNSNVSYRQFGLNGDLPTPAAF